MQEKGYSDVRAGSKMLFAWDKDKRKMRIQLRSKEVYECEMADDFTFINAKRVFTTA